MCCGGHSEYLEEEHGNAQRKLMMALTNLLPLKEMPKSFVIRGSGEENTRNFRRNTSMMVENIKALI